MPLDLRLHFRDFDEERAVRVIVVFFQEPFQLT